MPFLSPEVISSMLWFLNQWAAVYIDKGNSTPEQESSQCNCTLGINSAGGIWAVNYLLEQSVNYLIYLNSEPGVCRDAVNLFNSLVGDKTKYVRKKHYLRL